MFHESKTALLICKESYTYPMSFLKDELQSRGYAVEALFVHYTETILENHSYLSFRQKNADVATYTFDGAIRTFWANYEISEQLVDKQYLQYVEREYCKDLPFGLLLMSTQLFTTPYHYRFYLRDLSEHEKLYWVQLVFKEVERILETSKIDRIIDIDNSELGRTVLFQVAKAKKIPYATLESSRYGSVLLPTFTLGRTTDQYFIAKYREILGSKKIDPEYMQKVDDFRNLENIMVPDYKYNNTGKKHSPPLIDDIKKIALIVKGLVVEWSKNPKVFGLFRRRPMIASLFHASVFFLLWIIRERYLLSKRTGFFDEPESSDTYVYFPLHLVPESTTLIKSPFYPNEIAVIEAISKALPMGWKLYVKEHGAMIGERPLGFYRQIKRLTNVRFMMLDFYPDPKPWIQNSVGVITLSGTAAFEAAMMGKPSLMFGNTLFELIEGVDKVGSFTDLPGKIRNMGTAVIDNKVSCAAYLQAVHQLGKYIPLAELLVKSQKAMFDNEPLSVEMKVVIRDLADILLMDVKNEGDLKCAA